MEMDVDSEDKAVAKKSKPETESENKRQKICQICGDFSLGYNFGAITCESCKAFFRRNALRLKEFTCPFENSCKIDSVTRRFCQKCRLKKCFFIGMRKDWILTENEKAQKRKKRNDVTSQQKAMEGTQTTNKNRRKPQALVKPNSRNCIQDDDFSMRSNSPPTEKGTPIRPLPVQNTSVFDPITSPNEPESVKDSNTILSEDQPAYNLSQNRSNFHPSFVTEKIEAHKYNDPTFKCKMEEANAETSFPKEDDKFLSIDQIISVAIKAEFESDSLVNGCHRSLAKLNDREQAKLHELYIASRCLDEPVGIEEDSTFNRYNNEPTLISVINLTDLAIKRIIKMAKQIFSFTQLCQEDQVSLLKGGCIELMILRSVINFDLEKNAWQIPGSSSLRVLSMDVLKEATQLGVNLYEEHQRFVSSFSPVWKNNENIMLLLSAIALFSPDRVNVVHANVVKSEQDSYFYLLKRYLETQYSGCEAKQVYLQLIGKLLELHRLNESHIKLFMEVNPKQIEPLLIEIFDLNSQKIQK